MDTPHRSVFTIGMCQTSREGLASCTASDYLGSPQIVTPLTRDGFI